MNTANADSYPRFMQQGLMFSDIIHANSKFLLSKKPQREGISIIMESEHTHIKHPPIVSLILKVEKTRRSLVKAWRNWANNCAIVYMTM